MIRRNLTGFLCLLCACATMIFSCQPSKQSGPTFSSFSPREQAEVDSFLHQLRRSIPIPGLAVAIVKGNEIMYKSVGYRDLESKLPMSATTPLFMGNISELMTATGIVKLANEGKISLDDPVAKYLPYFKIGDTVRTAIKIKHLLTHTSGVPHHDAVWDLPTFDATALEFTTTSISRQPPEFKTPGSKVKRSQYNYDILADLIEKASGMRFEDYMNNEVLKPLHLQHSAYYDTTIQQGVVAQPHRISNWLTYELANEKLYPHNREHAGSIGFHASVEDLAGWMSMLLHGGKVGDEAFINEGLHQQLLKAHFKTGANTYVGFGWEIREQDSLRIYSKNHYLGGFSGDITLIPEQHIGVVVISNVAGEFDTSIISDEIIQWLWGEDFDKPKMPVSMVMGRALQENNSLEKTLAMYTALKHGSPDRYDFSHLSLSKLGINLLHRLNRKEDAIRVFDFILEQHPSSPYAHLNLAEAYVVNNDIQRAEEQIRIVKALAFAPEETIKSHMAYLEEAIGIMKEEKHEMPASFD